MGGSLLPLHAEGRRGRGDPSDCAAQDPLLLKLAHRLELVLRAEVQGDAVGLNRARELLQLDAPEHPGHPQPVDTVAAAPVRHATDRAGDAHLEARVHMTSFFKGMIGWRGAARAVCFAMAPLAPIDVVEWVGASLCRGSFFHRPRHPEK